MGLGRGKKACDKCGTVTGPRAYMCKNCNTPFMFKNKSREDRNTKIIRNIDYIRFFYNQPDKKRYLKQ